MQSSGFLDSIQLHLAPPDRRIIARYLPRLVEQFEDLGLEPVLSHDFDALKRLTEINRSSWFSLMPIFDPAIQDPQLLAEQGFWIGGIADGRVVCCMAFRSRFVPRNLARSLEDLTFVYDDPARASPGESIAVDSPLAAQVKGYVGLSGALWVDPQWRGRRIAALLTRMTHVVGFATLAVDWIVAIIALPNTSTIVFRFQNFSAIESGISWSFPTLPKHHEDGHLSIAFKSRTDVRAEILRDCGFLNSVPGVDNQADLTLAAAPHHRSSQPAARSAGR